MDSRVYWIWLAQALTPGNAAIEPLLAAFGDAAAVYAADEAALRPLSLPPELAARLSDKSLKEARAILERTVNVGDWILTPADAAYPACLQRLTDRPAVLYGRGTMPDLETFPGIGLVGTRGASAQGLTDAYRMAAGLAAAGAIVVSGGALGIDAAAHAGAIAGGGATVVVLACPTTVSYPEENESLRRQAVRAGGALLSEFPPGLPYKCVFAVRNRLIAGLSQGVCLGETPLRSGARITARLAREQGRDVFAMPGTLAGHINDGAHREIRDGAELVTRASELLQEYTALYPGILNTDAADRTEERLEQAEKPDVAAGTRPRKAARADKAAAKAARKAVRAAKRRPAAEPAESRGPETAKDPAAAPPDGASADARTVWQALDTRPLAVDELAGQTGLPVPRLLAALTELEMLGGAKNSAGQKYSRG